MSTPRPLGRDTAATMEFAGLNRELVAPAPRLFRGPLPRRSPDLTKFRNMRFRHQVRGTCVGQSGAAMAETTARTPDPLTPESVPQPGPDLSPLWVYQIARRKTYDLGGRSIFNGEGAIVTHALLAVKEQGFISWDAWPGTEANERAYRDNVTPASARDAKRYMPIQDVRSLDGGPDQILEYLAGGHSVWIGTNWPEGATNTRSDGYFPWSGRSVGGHATELLAYDLDADQVFVGNSWDGWGLPGSIGWTRWSHLAREFEGNALRDGRSEAVVATEIDGWRPRIDHGLLAP